MDPKSEQYLSGKHSEDSGLSPQDLRVLSPVLRHVILNEESSPVREKILSAFTLGNFVRELVQAKLTTEDQLKVLDSIKSQRAKYELEALVCEPSVVSNPPLSVGGWRSLVEGINLWAPKGLENYRHKREPNSDRHPFVDEVVRWVTTQFQRELSLFSAADHRNAGWIAASAKSHAPVESKFEEELARKAIALGALTAFTRGYSDDTSRTAIRSFVKPWLDHYLFGNSDPQLDLTSVRGIAKRFIDVGEPAFEVIERLSEIHRKIMAKVDLIPINEEQGPSRKLPSITFDGIGESLDKSQKGDDFLKRLSDRCKGFSNLDNARLFSILESASDILADYRGSNKERQVLRDYHQVHALLEMWRWGERSEVALIEFPLNTVAPTSSKERQQFAQDLRITADILLKLEPSDYIREGVGLLYEYTRVQLLLNPETVGQS